LANNTSSEAIERADIIVVGNHKYVIHKITRKNIELLPIDLLLESDESIDLIPKLTISQESLSSYTKVDNYELLYLLNQKNPLIVEALSYFLENAEN
jgi:hypothetical protein